MFNNALSNAAFGETLDLVNILSIPAEAQYKKSAIFPILI